MLLHGRRRRRGASLFGGIAALSAEELEGARRIFAASSIVNGISKAALDELGKA